MTKVLHIGLSSTLGGIETFVKYHYEHIDRSTVQFDFLKTEDAICFESDFISQGSRLFQIPPRTMILQHYFGLLTFFRAHRTYSFVHFHINTCSWIAPALFAWFYGIPLIVHSHNQWRGRSLKTRFLHLINRPLVRTIATLRFACSHVAAEWLFGRVVSRRGSYHLVRNAIDATRYSFSPTTRERKRQELGGRYRFIVGHVGRFVYQKNHEFLIRVFAEVHRRFPDALLVLIGDGPLRGQVQRQVSSLRLENNVSFLGVRSDVRELLQAMDVFLLPSRYEGLPLATVEAQAAGLRCVIANTITQETTITELVNVVDVHESPSSWADVLLKDDMQYGSRQGRGMEVRMAGYDVRANAEWLQELYTRGLRA